MQYITIKEQNKKSVLEKKKTEKRKRNPNSKDKKIFRMYRTQRDTEYMRFLECTERTAGQEVSNGSCEKLHKNCTPSKNCTETAQHHAVSV